MYPYVVADIGGTNARFALVTGKQDQRYQIERVSILSGAEFPSFEGALSHYLQGIGSKPKSACIAIAGPTDSDQIRMTNLPWSFSRAAVREQFQLEAFEVLNDFGALAIATIRLQDEHLQNVKSGLRDPRANKAILGAGTGLGVAGLGFSPAGWYPIQSEGGHVNIAPANAFECEIVKAAMQQHSYVSMEVFLSGPGLVNLYRAVCAVKGVEANELEPRDISARALDNSDSFCRDALELFCAFFGSLSGNLALTYGAKGGVYIAGGIVPRFIDFFRASHFVERFSDKGVMSRYVKDIPVDVVVYEHTAFVGAAAWLDQLLGD